MYVRVHIYINIYIYMYTHTHTYKHTVHSMSHGTCHIAASTWHAVHQMRQYNTFPSLPDHFMSHTRPF